MKQYLDFLKHVLDFGRPRPDRTGTGTLSCFGYQMRFGLLEGFPLLTTKKLHWKSIVHELLWFLSGDTTIHYLHQHGIKIWDAWADKNGELGPVYGKQWRAWKTPEGTTCIDQITQIVSEIRQNPYSRRLLVSAWNVADLPAMVLPPCHVLFQFYVSEGTLSCQLYQRSADAFLGLPFNIASYSLLTHLIAHQCDLRVGDFIWSGGDCHIYTNHLPQVTLQLGREPRPLPKLTLLRKADSLFSYKFEDFSLNNYHPYPIIKGVVSV